MEQRKVDDSKLKPLSPTLRVKKRFIKIELESSKKYDFKEFSSTLNDELITLLGSIDFGKFGVWILKDKFDSKNQTAVLKVSTKGRDKLLGALALISKFGKDEVKIKIIKVSGTLKGLEN